MRPQIPERPEQLDAHHQDDEERFDAHVALDDAVGAESERRRGADSDTGVGEAAAKRIGGVDAPRTVGEFVCTPRQRGGPVARLTKRFQRGEALHGVEEFGCECAERTGSRETGLQIEAV